MPGFLPLPLPMAASRAYSGRVSEGVGGEPFPDGDDHGGADEEFASVVFDEAFVKAASYHEPTARERLLTAAQARAEAEAARARVGADDDPEDGYPVRRAGGYDESDLGLYGGQYRHRKAFGSHTRWHRTVAWLLAVLMGIGVVALTFAAVYRGAGSGSRQPTPPPPPATGQVGISHPPVEVASPAAR